MTPLEEGKDEPSENGTTDHRTSKVTITDSVLTFQSSERVDNSCYRRFQRITGKIYKVTSSIFGIIILLVGYSFLGAWIFMIIESDKEPIKVNITNARDAIIGQLLNTNTVTVGSDSSLKERLEQMLVGYEADIMKAYKAGVTTPSTEETWGFWRSLFFCGTVYTTIGYGHIAPRTDLGRGICMLYAALGIPLALLVLAELGKRFTVALKFLWAFVRRYYYAGYCRKNRRPLAKDNKTEQNEKHGDTKSDSDSNKGSTRLVYGYEVNESFNLPISVAVTILIVYILLGACMYSIWEDWTYLEAIYFVFISLSTIGFGDVIPAHTNFFIISSLYIFIGLSLVSMCINVAIEFFHATADAAKHTVGRATKTIGKKVTAAADKVHHLGYHLGTNIKDETDRLKHITDETIKKWKKSKSRSRSNTPKRSISNESGSSYDSRQIEEECSTRRESSVSADTQRC